MVPQLAILALVLSYTGCAHGPAGQVTRPSPPETGSLDELADSGTPEAPGLLLELRSGGLMGRHAVWAREAGGHWVEHRIPGSSEGTDEVASWLRTMDGHRAAWESLCDQAFDRLASLPGVLPMAGTPKEAEYRRYRMFVPDEGLALAVQRADRSSANLVTSLETGRFAWFEPWIDSKEDLRFAWSGDGKLIAFVSVDTSWAVGKGKARSSVLLVDPSGPSVRSRHGVPYLVRDLAWSADGRSVALLALDVEPRVRAVALPRSDQPFHEECDVFVVVLDIGSGVLDVQHVTSGLLDVVGTLVWDPKAVKAPPWPADGPG